MRILKDYNKYVMRNLARGYSRKDLGVSYVKVWKYELIVYTSPVISWCLLMEFWDRSFLSCQYQEQQLRVNMGITKLREKVKEQQEKVGKKVVIYNH